MKSVWIILFIILTRNQLWAQQLYFPPLNNNAPWDTLAPASLGWCTDKVDSLYDFLQQENSKAFILLKDGKIILEKYFGSFTKDSIWYWASAGKTLTAFLVGKAQEEGFLSVNDTTSAYLGAGWTSCTSSQEEQIKIIHQLTMTTGLDDGVTDNHCTLDTCLQYLADPGTRWAYHNAPYTLLEGVLSNATGTPINTYTQAKIKNATGMNGFWLYVDFDNVFFSTPRSMARYGLLIQNRGIWNSDTLLYDTAYFNQMTNTSQTLNYSYGYLWWLNGKQSYMVPSLQTVIPGSYAPQAPVDMFAGLGKNGQILSIAPTAGLVFVRMGDAPNSPAAEIATIFCNQIWQKINDITCTTASIPENVNTIAGLILSPNPTNGEVMVAWTGNKFAARVTDITGRQVFLSGGVNDRCLIDLSPFNTGIYLLQIKTEKGYLVNRKIILEN
jgi:CubicO group peptidase (beta-lactamase class C family)